MWKETALCPRGILLLFAPGLEQLVLCNTCQVPGLPGDSSWYSSLPLLLGFCLWPLASALPALCCGATGTFWWCCRFEHYICCQRCVMPWSSSGQPLTLGKTLEKVDQRVLQTAPSNLVYTVPYRPCRQSHKGWEAVRRPLTLDKAHITHLTVLWSMHLSWLTS